MTQPRALLTGATGFIGAQLLQHLLAAGWQVAVLAREPTQIDPRAQAFTYTGQTEEVMAACATFQPSAVFHLASLFLATHIPAQVAPLVAANILFGTQLLEAMRAAGCTVMVNAGTGWQNYTPAPPFDNPAYRPVNLYAATKQAFEGILTFYVETASLRVTTLRLFDSYGPGDPRRKLLRLLLEALRTGEPLGMSPGDQIVDLVHVDDICRAFLHAAALLTANPAPAQNVYALSGGERRTLREVAATLAGAAGRPLPVEFGARPHRDREVMHPWQGPALPGWTPQISLLEGFRALIAKA